MAWLPPKSCLLCFVKKIEMFPLQTRTEDLKVAHGMELRESYPQRRIPHVIYKCLLYIHIHSYNLHVGLRDGMCARSFVCFRC